MERLDQGSPTTVLLWWIPVGAGGQVARRTSRWWELARARLARRAPHQLFHAALEIAVDGTRFVIEMAPAWSGPQGTDRGVAVTGPVGVRALGHWRLFRYEVRCWPDGTIPDLRWAVGGPVILTTDRATTRTIVGNVRDVPPLTWGRNVEPADDMWNSNSVVSWLLVTAGIPTSTVVPPAGGSAPGWQAGLALGAGGRPESATP